MSEPVKTKVATGSHAFEGPTWSGNYTVAHVSYPIDRVALLTGRIDFVDPQNCHQHDCWTSLEALRADSEDAPVVLVEQNA
jgi:hypothetical protein